MVEREILLVEYDNHLAVARKNWWTHAECMQFGGVVVEEGATSQCRIVGLEMLHENGAGIGMMVLAKEHENHIRDS